MTTVNSVSVAQAMPPRSDAVGASSQNSFIADLANVKPEQAAALADKTFTALGKDGIALLPFLRAFVDAFKQPGANGSGGATNGASSSGANTKADIGSATQSLLAFRNANPGVKDLDQIIGAISKALPNLSQADFDSILANLKTAAAPNQSAAGTPKSSKAAMSDPFGGSAQLSMAAQPEIDKFEMSLLEGQLAAATGKNTAAPSSATGNQALDQILGAITEIGKDGVTADEKKALAGILADTTVALLGPEKAASVLASLNPSRSSGQGLDLQLSVTVGQGGSGQAAATPNGSNSQSPGATGSARGFDGMLEFYKARYLDAKAVNFDLNTTDGSVYGFAESAFKKTTGGSLTDYMQGLNGDKAKKGGFV